MPLTMMKRPGGTAGQHIKMIDFVGDLGAH